MPLRLLPAAELPARSAPPHPRLARGGPGCRVLTTFNMLAEIGERPTAEQALAALSAAVDRAITHGVAA